MMQAPLVLTNFFKRAESYFARKTIVSRTSPTKIHRLTYGEWAKRTRRLADALTKLGMEKGMKVGSFAWNQHRHLEAYFAVPCSGAVLHMVNIRLSEEHLIYIINHAEDQILMIDADLVPIIENIASELKTVKHYIIMTDEETLPETTLPNALSYEDLLAAADENFEFPENLEEEAPAGMCYTSATTGNPKGVVYTHRGLVLHSTMLNMADSMGISERDVVMPIVPMFHANAWGLPFASVNVGATQVLPGPHFTSDLILDLIEQEKITLTAGVPTIWLSALQEQEKRERNISSLRAICAGGSASPAGLIRTFEEKYGIPYIVVYGMTETTPIVALSNYMSWMEEWPIEKRVEARGMQGMTMPGIESSIINEEGEVPWDGETMGELRLRGPWISHEYYRDERTQDAYRDGWLYTGDIAVRSADGFFKIMDRTKDLIKSGGEWISSVDLENALMTHEAVFEAAVIAIPHAKWQERPLACVVLKEGKSVTDEELLAFLESQFAKWWVPDDIVFLDEIPKTSVGKFLKAKLRDNVAEIYPKLNSLV
ncbi:fatty-acid--CoA ligase [Lysinibacillus contaminans]|uniref:Fatty-acid--CoA ligase n=1 Tax=Lysinibacillus contaminans TaxID=1293441 RepID=A0ABR5JWX8_9BACI|nr:long-chain fatty acid--CoA ligase [Lysinibacillus contaminans]KOS66499.1 fatty-acid--CoA ligase [Lysinibacillus contaminans]